MAKRRTNSGQHIARQRMLCFNLDTFCYTASLLMLNFTLTLLVYNQYAVEQPSVGSLLSSSLLKSPSAVVLLLLIAALHHRADSPTGQAFFTCASVICGCWVVRTSNIDPYLATMKRAPPLGTLWIWAVVELRAGFAALSVLIVVSWGWWQGYSLS